MTLPLTNTIDTENYIEDSIKVMYEFLSEYFNALQGFPAVIRVDQDPSNNEFDSPFIRFSLDPQTDDERGAIGLDDLNNVIQGKFKSLSWEINIVTDDNTGGPLVLDRYASRLEYVISKYSYYLSEKKLSKHQLYGPNRIDLNNYYQRTFILTNRLLLCRG